MSYTVEVRRPLHRKSPWARFKERWRARRKRREDGSGTWFDGLEMLNGFDEVPVVAIIGIAVAAIVALFFVGPWLWLLVLLLIELILWVALFALGIAAAALLRRPWRVVVVDAEGEEVASERVVGRRNADEHADIVRTRLAGADQQVDLAAAVRRS